jgi:2-dehydro-3-deoxyphosphogluconate aldolase/(4S)-4-hydroxy-2-oxoglutarate aldolase
MTRFGKNTLLRMIAAQGFVPLFYYEDLRVCKLVIEACFDGGCRVIEFTNRGEKALPMFAELAAHAHSLSPDMAFGVGSIVDLHAANAFVDSGADFVVGPSFCEETAAYCHDREVVYIPGCATLTEILRAERAGCELIKVFPASCLGGAEFIKAVRGPCPWLKLMPTGGVNDDPSELAKWFKAGVAAVGLGSNVISNSRMENEDYKGIGESVRNVASLIRTLR